MGDLVEKIYGLYKEGKISLGKAAELCGLYYDELLEELKKRKLPLLLGARKLEEARKEDVALEKYLRKQDSS